MNQPNVRSTTHRRGTTTNPIAPAGRFINCTVQFQKREAHLINPAYAESAHTKRSEGNSWLLPFRSCLAPAKSLTSAAVTSTMSTSPKLSTSTCRLRPTTFFSPVVPSRAGQRRRLHGLAVESGRRWLRIATVQEAAVIAQGIVDVLPRSVLLPAAQVAVDGVPRGKVVGQHAPRAAASQYIKDRVHNVAAIVFGGSAARFWGWDQVSDVRPLPILEIGRIALPAHGRYLTRCQLHYNQAFSTGSYRI